MKTSMGRAGVLEWRLEYVTTPEALARCVTWLRQQRQVGLDLETSGLDPVKDRIATLQLGNPRGPDPVVWVLDVRCFQAQELTPVFQVLRNPEVLKVGANLSFEARFLEAQYGVQLRRLADTQLTELLLRSGLFPKSKSSGPEDTASTGAYKFVSLKAVCQRYLGLEIDKDHEVRTSFDKVLPGQHNREQLHYAALDVLYPFYILEAQARELDARGLMALARIEYALIPVLAHAELWGMRLDVPAWLKLWQEAHTRRGELRRQLDRLVQGALSQLELLPLPPDTPPLYPRTRQAVNYASAAQLKWVIRAYCSAINWPRTLVTTKAHFRRLQAQFGQEWLARQAKWGHTRSVDDVPAGLIPEDTYTLLLDTKVPTLQLARLRGQLPSDLVDLLLEYSKVTMLDETFGRDFVAKHVKLDGLIHTTFHQLLASTGRLSSKPNSQNWPRDQRYRRCCVPRPGYKFCIADYGQVEPRITAELSQDPVYVQTFLDEADIYLRAGEAILGHPVDKDTPEGKLFRQIFKVMVLALAYRMGPWKLRNQLTLALADEILAGRIKPPTIEYVRELHTRFFEVHAGIKRYQDAQSERARPQGTGPKLYDAMLGEPVTYVESLCGRKRFFPPDARTTYTEGPNGPVQGLSATMTKVTMVTLQEVIDQDGWDAHMVNNIHDELVYEVREDQAVAFAELLRQHMVAAGQRYVRSVPITAEFPKGTNGVCDAWIKEAA